MAATAAGTTPKGTQGEEQAASWVQRTFSDIAPRYDLLNHLLSFNIDKTWRKRLIQAVARELADPQSVILDLCCGTGDVTIDLQQSSQARIVGADFCHPMLVAARRKSGARNLPARFFEGDAMLLPIADSSLDAITIAFGFRNLTNYIAALREFRRVLRPRGTLAILEFSHPQGWLTRLGYGLYSRILLPWIGGAVSGSREAYSYLPESIRKFPGAEGLRSMTEEAGFTQTRFELLSGGIAALHVGEKL